jgi:hypothetical protein
MSVCGFSCGMHVVMASCVGAMVLPGPCSYKLGWGGYLCVPGVTFSGLASGWKPDPMPLAGKRGFGGQWQWHDEFEVGSMQMRCSCYCCLASNHPQRHREPHGMILNLSGTWSDASRQSSAGSHALSRSLAALQPQCTATATPHSWALLQQTNSLA